MPRPTTAQTLEQIIQTAAAEVVAQVSSAIARSVADIAARELEKSLSPGAAASAPAGLARRGRSRPRVEVTRWVADKRARRVPNFVIQATGLDTKKAIVARFGDGAAFEKGKPAPKPLK
ncbi:hypothetical protein [Anaeromyxobacter paludicola]|uniref:HK97 gp10 family phage protein n=1 Tax=Anaeromyxobacter paludicola TaxID=2918171 RepID=A0ABM7XDQ7_9BACT|nr:hypothetical protein [Anaeromyxobacter paludicola]BDG10000.1 hypothetical protein AMPC_31130 [Anaeromyxobacter paludicola]